MPNLQPGSWRKEKASRLHMKSCVFVAPLSSRPSSPTRVERLRRNVAARYMPNLQPGSWRKEKASRLHMLVSKSWDPGSACFPCQDVSRCAPALSSPPWVGNVRLMQQNFLGADPGATVVCVCVCCVFPRDSHSWRRIRFHAGTVEVAQIQASSARPCTGILWRGLSGWRLGIKQADCGS